MANFKVSKDDVTNAVTFLEQYLQTKLTKYDFSVGTANRDIAINAMAYLTAFFRQEISYVKNRQSLLKLADISEDDSADEVVDEILSDWFLTRKTGELSHGYATLRFSRNNIGVVLITQDHIFRKGGLDFRLDGVSITLQTTSLTRNVDNLGSVYYTASIPLVADQVGPEYDIEAGPFDEVPKISPYLVRAEALSKFSGGATKETSAQMIERSKNAITVRDLNTQLSIKTVLTDKFSQVSEVSPIGYGDPEMMRDKLEVPRGAGTFITIHRGSMVDAYLKLPVEFSKTYTGQFTSSQGLSVQNYQVNGVSITAVQLPLFPIYKIRALLDNSTSPATEVPFTIVSPKIDTWNSNRQEIYLSVGTEYFGQYLDLLYDTVTGYDEVQTFVEENRNRIIVADLLCKAAFPLYLSFELKYSPSVSDIADIEAAKRSLATYIQDRTIGAEFRVSEIIDKFVKDNPGQIVQLPFVVVGTLLLPNGTTLSITYTDRIEAPTRYSATSLTPLFSQDEDPEGQTIIDLADLQLSSRTMRYIVATEDITLTALSDF